MPTPPKKRTPTAVRKAARRYQQENGTRYTEALREVTSASSTNDLRDRVQLASTAREFASLLLKESISSLQLREDIAKLVFSMVATNMSSRVVVFEGPYGTVKTTAARILAKALHTVGVTVSDKVTEVNRFDLVSLYQGHTEEKTSQVVYSARGGVLLVDEADKLGDVDSDTFGLEALSILVDRVKEDGAPLIILSGSGIQTLRSQRYLATWAPITISFPSFTEEDAVFSFRVLADERGRVLADGVSESVKQVTQSLMDTDHRGVKLIDNMGNGRMVKHLLEYAEISLNERLMKCNKDSYTVSDEELITIIPEDIVSAARVLIGLARTS